MRKELKISELATVWGVSVPTTWKRLERMGLETFKKKDETNKEVNYVSISDEQINEYIINVINNNNNVNYNGYYEETLQNNNVNNDVIDAEYCKSSSMTPSELVNNLQKVFNDCNDRLLTNIISNNERIDNVYNDYKNICEELADHKANTKLLEDKRASEGLYLNEIRELKQEKENLNKDYNELKIANNNLNNEKENYLKSCNELSEKLEVIETINKKQIRNDKIKNAIIAVLLLAVVSFITILIMDNKQVNNASETVTNVQEPVTAQVPQPVQNVSNQRKR